VAKTSVKKPSKKGAAAKNLKKPPSKSKSKPALKIVAKAKSAAKSPAVKSAPKPVVANAKNLKTKAIAKTPEIKASSKNASAKSAAKNIVMPAPASHVVRLFPAKPSSVVQAKPTKVVKVEKAVKKSSNGSPRPVENLPVQAAPVPTDGKPRKNQAGISPKELEHFRELLLAKRRELVGDMSSMEREALRSTTGTNLSNLPLHMADMGTDNYEQEFTLGLVEKDRQLLREINQALAKIQDGTYGLCEGTGKPISKPRLEAQPWAKFSIEHARMMERNGMGIRRP